MDMTILDPIVRGGKLLCRYRLNDKIYTHRFMFQQPLGVIDDPYLTGIFKWLAMAHAPYLFSIDYPEKIVTTFSLSKGEVDFFEKLYFLGMAEFRYINKLPITRKTFIIPDSTITKGMTLSPDAPSGRLLLNGGGKDGATSAALLKSSGMDFTWFQMNSSVAQSNITSAIAAPIASTKRYMDERRFEGQYQGHRPTSAAIATIALVHAYLTKTRDIIASNEASSNDGNVILDGVSINHQYSKSLEFECDFSKLIKHHGLHQRYFSLLRPLHELQIIQRIPTQIANHFVSCNHGFGRGVWCMSCAKCAFVVLGISAMRPELTSSIWPSTPHPLTTPELYSHLEELLLEDKIKPFECVGTLDECLHAARLILNSAESQHLTQPVRELFERAVGDQLPVPIYIENSFSEHLIPADYSTVLDLMRLPKVSSI